MLELAAHLPVCKLVIEDMVRMDQKGKKGVGRLEMVHLETELEWTDGGKRRRQRRGPRR